MYLPRISAGVQRYALTTAAGAVRAAALPGSICWGQCKGSSSGEGWTPFCSTDDTTNCEQYATTQCDDLGKPLAYHLVSSVPLTQSYGRSKNYGVYCNIHNSIPTMRRLK